MPSDLFSLQSNEDFLVASPESQTPKLEGSDSSSAIGDEEANVSFTIQKEYLGAQELGDSRAKANESINLHPYAQTLSLSNLECCVALENAVFPKHERCSREKVGFLQHLSSK